MITIPSKVNQPRRKVARHGRSGADIKQLRQSVGVGQVLVQTYTVEIEDGHGGTATQLVTITINGTNDAAVITGETTGTVVEAGGVNNGTPGTPTATGDLNSTDVDDDPDDSWEVISSPTASTNGYGTFTIDGVGGWTYTLDNNNAAVQALNAGDSRSPTPSRSPPSTAPSRS